MGKVNVNFANVAAKIQELETYTQQNITNKAETKYAELQQILGEAEGAFKDEMVNALEMERQTISSFTDYMRSIYALIWKSSSEFETVDNQHAETIGTYLTDKTE